MTEPKNSRIDILDAGRMVAALAVAMYHYCGNGFRNGKIPLEAPQVPDFTHYGYLGVHFFFLISGFVILQSALTRTADKFAVGRVQRLWPAFVVCMTLTAVVQVFFATPGMTVSLPQYVANLTMVPKLIGFAPIDGAYWTLLYELVFYGTVTVCILAGFQKRAQLLSELWLAAIAAQMLVSGSFLLFDGFFALFAGGCLLSLSARQGWNVRLAISILAAAALAAMHTYQTADAEIVSPLVAGVIALLLFGIVGAVATTKLSTIKVPGAHIAGAISYPFYLLHAHLGYMAIAHAGVYFDLGLVIPTVLLAVFCLAYAVVILVERRFRNQTYTAADRLVGGLMRVAMHWLDRLTLRQKARPSPSSQPY